MRFKTLKDRMDYFRSLSDYKLMPNTYVIIMVDGRAFSKNIKKRYKRPFDEKFLEMMDTTAAHLCKNIQGSKLAFVQSDEISVVVTDFDTPTTEAFFGNRLCKLQSIAASMATSIFNNLEVLNLLEEENHKELIKERGLLEFDCKAWNVPTLNDVFAWFLYRQIDCIRNSKGQTAQTYLPHGALCKKTCDEQVELLREEKGIDWNEFPDGQKYGRFVYKEEEKFFNDKINKEYMRTVWKSHDAFPLTEEGSKVRFVKLTGIPIIN